MKPSFALNFADDAIEVLHRTSRGWMEVGRVALDDPDIGASLAYLRGSALGLEPRGLTTKLVIPNSQIRYMTLPAAGPDAASRRAQIRRELEGKTPYEVDELVFDWWGKGPSVQVAVVARETLGQRLPCFVPAHPIAGKEVAGVEHAQTDLYQNRQLILTPQACNGLRKITQAHHVWQAIGCQVISLSPEQHDATFAAVSHLPHLVAFALVNAVAQQPQGADHLAMAGPGFRDFSRIAASDASVWRDILSANHAEVLTQVAHFRAALDQFENALKQGDTPRLQHLIQQASDVRSAWTLQAGNACNKASED